jgi:hypothetical protein
MTRPISFTYSDFPTVAFGFSIPQAKHPEDLRYFQPAGFKHPWALWGDHAMVADKSCAAAFQIPDAYWDWYCEQGGPEADGLVARIFKDPRSPESFREAISTVIRNSFEEWRSVRLRSDGVDFPPTQIEIRREEPMPELSATGATTVFVIEPSGQSSSSTWEGLDFEKTTNPFLTFNSQKMPSAGLGVRFMIDQPNAHI